MLTLIEKTINWYFKQPFINKGKHWVAQSIIRPYFRQVTCRSKDGFWFTIDPRDMVQLSILTIGEWEPAETQVLKENLKLDQTFYDIGANYGYFSILASHLVGEKGHVYAFEPNPLILKRLEHNLALNGIQNVTVFPYAVADRMGEHEIYLGEAGNSGLTSFRPIGASNQKLKVKTICLDDFVLANDLLTPDVIKMDIEGAEYLACLGMTSLLANTRQLKLLVEVSDYFLSQVAGSEESLLEEFYRKGMIIQKETS